MTVSGADLDKRIRDVSRLLSGHAGGIELVDLSTDGSVLVRFVGSCTGCPVKALTLIASVRPALRSVEGVTGVEAIGVRLSAEAETRLALRSILPRRS